MNDIHNGISMKVKPMLSSFRRALFAAWVLGLSACAAGPFSEDAAGPSASPRYFASPEEAVAQASKLMMEEDWTTLAAYCEGEVDSATGRSLNDGNYFVRPMKGEDGEDSAARSFHPFYPGSEFSRVVPTDEPDEVEVIVKYATEAEGGLRLRGYDSFRMKRSDQGWRILPE